MKDEMPRPRDPHLHRQVSRHGRTVWYFREGHGPRIRLRAVFGTPEFKAEYEAAKKGEAYVPAGKVRSGSLRWLYDRYRESPAWLKEISQATRRQRLNILDRVMAKSGPVPFVQINRASIEAGKEDRRATPSQARNFIDAMRGMFGWAVARGHLKKDPTEGVEYPPRPKTKGFPAWTEFDVETYQKKFPLGTKERVWLDMILYTGPRRGDVCGLGRQHTKMVVDPRTGRECKVISFKTEKGGEMIEVTIPILPILQATIDAGPCGDLAFIVGDRGHPLTKESFGNAFSAAARKAGIKKSAHGVRKIAATTAADNGATVHQLMAIFGWTTTQMAERYTKEADRRRLARDGAHTLTRTPEQQAIPSPVEPVRELG